MMQKKKNQTGDKAFYWKLTTYFLDEMQSPLMIE